MAQQQLAEARADGAQARRVSAATPMSPLSAGHRRAGSAASSSSPAPMSMKTAVLVGMYRRGRSLARRCLCSRCRCLCLDTRADLCLAAVATQKMHHGANQPLRASYARKLIETVRCLLCCCCRMLNC
jgi:hypothetical protein